MQWRVQTSPLPLMVERHKDGRMFLSMLMTEKERQIWLRTFEKLSEEEAGSWTVLGGIFDDV